MVLETADPRRDACDYCGLPLGGWGRPSSIAAESPEQPHFCCLGCRLASAITSEAAEEGQVRWTLARLGLAVFFTMNVMVFAMALWTYSEAHGEHEPAARAWSELLRYGSLLFAAPVLLLLGGPLLEDAVATLRRRRLNVDCLLALGVAASFGYSVLALARGGQHAYFEVGCMILVAVTLGRWMEATGKQRTRQALLGLQRLLPDTARVVTRSLDSQRPSDADLYDVELRQLQTPRDAIRIGDVARVLPGERLPVDGRVVRGQATIDQQLITGETEPAYRAAGDDVFAGSLCLDGELWIRTTAAAQDDTLHRLMLAVEEAASRPSSSERLADRWARWFVPAVMILSAATFAAHLSPAGFHEALMSGLAVLLIACPCALGVATPMAIWSALGCASRRQVLFRDGDALCELGKVTTLCSDKTGTLTTGELEFKRIVLAEQVDDRRVWDIAVELSRGGDHAMSRAIVRDPRANLSQRMAIDVRTMPGRGLTGAGLTGDAADSGDVYLGSLRWMREESHDIDPRLQAALDDPAHRADLVCCLAWSGRVRALFFFGEQLRPETKSALRALKRQGLAPMVLSGDRSTAVAALGAELGIAAQGELLPEDKLRRIEELRRLGTRVAMLGDGVNDAPALAAADLGVAMGCGADVSRDAAHVCLLGDDLMRLSWARSLAVRTTTVIRQNLLWTLAYNSVGIGLAVSGRLSPILAAIAMVGSSLLVVTNSLRLANFDHDGDADPNERSRNASRRPRIDRGDEDEVLGPSSRQGESDWVRGSHAPAARIEARRALTRVARGDD